MTKSKKIDLYIRTIRNYLKNNHNYIYSNPPKQHILINDVVSIIKQTDNNKLFEPFIDRKSNHDRLLYIYNYIKLLPNNKIRPVKKSASANQRKISPTWVKSKIDKLENNEKWQAVRYQALKAGNGRCCLCGMGASDGVKLHVDHIKPKSIYPELIYDVDNLQVLCEPCNLGKCNFDDTDWRSKSTKINP